MSKVVHFEIPADDIERAQNFYHDVFGWKINEMPKMKYTIVHTGPLDEQNMPKESGFINGGLMERRDEFQHPVITIDVDDIEEALEKITSKGGEVVMKKMEVGDMGWTAYFRDSEGNMIGLWQNKVNS
ncbi:VOC family protein [Patescibacteria group bacterium]|nr:VOC family protein [Patescibacteria group bacterium]